MSKSTTTIVLTDQIVSLAPNPATDITFSANITTSPLNQPSGNIAFVDSTRGTLFTSPIVMNKATYKVHMPVQGAVQPVTPELPRGTYSIVAHYAGDSSNSPAISNAVSIVVTQTNSIAAVPQTTAIFSLKTVIETLTVVAIIALVIFYFRSKKRTETAANV